MAEYLPGFAQSGTACKPVLTPELAIAHCPGEVFKGETRTPESGNNVDQDQYPRCKRPFELRPGHPGSKRA